MDLLLKEKNILVTGGSKGLGLACAKMLSEEGANIILVSREMENLLHAQKEFENIGLSTPFIFRADLSQLEQIQKLSRDILSKFDLIHGVIINTGGPPSGESLFITENQWHSAIDTNLLSYVRMCKEFIPILQKQKYGRILAITSVSAKQPIERLILSNTTRLGIAGYLKTLSNEVAKDNILINTILPGPTNTERLINLNKQKAAQLNKPLEDIEQEWIKNIPLGRLGKPEELAVLATFLISGRNTYITGQTIAVDGGYIQSPL